MFSITNPPPLSDESKAGEAGPCHVRRRTALAGAAHGAAHIPQVTSTPSLGRAGH